MRALATIAVYLVYAAALTVGLALIRRRSNASPTSRSWRAYVAIAAGLGLCTFVIAEPLKDLFQDFLEAYYAGGVAVLSGATSAEQLYSQGVNGFVNAPIGGAVFAPLSLLPDRIAAVVYLAIGVLASVACWRLLVRVADLDSHRALILGFWMLTNGPLMNSLKEGNTSHFALWAIAAAMLYVRDGKDARAGALLAALSVFKLPLVLFFVWAVLRGRWRLAASGGAVLAGVAVTSIVWFGWGVHVAWYEQFVASSGRSLVVAFNNQSFPAFFQRFVEPTGTLCNWEPIPLDRRSQLLSSLARVALLAAAVLASLWPRLTTRTVQRSSSLATELEMAMVAMLACLTSPLAWSHYYCWALLAIALLLAGGERAESRSALITQRVATVLVSLPVAWPWCSPAGALTVPYLLFVSHYLLGAILLFGLLARRRAGAPLSAAAEPAR